MDPVHSIAFSYSLGSIQRIKQGASHSDKYHATVQLGTIFAAMVHWQGLNSQPLDLWASALLTELLSYNIYLGQWTNDDSKDPFWCISVLMSREPFYKNKEDLFARPRRAVCPHTALNHWLSCQAAVLWSHNTSRLDCQTHVSLNKYHCTRIGLSAYCTVLLPSIALLSCPYWTILSSLSNKCTHNEVQ